MSNYYAVRTGRVPGIYGSWDACREQVDRFTGAIFKKFNNLGDAEAFVRHTIGRNEDGVRKHLSQGMGSASSILNAAINGQPAAVSYSSTRGVPSLFASVPSEDAFIPSARPRSTSSSSSSSSFSNTNPNTHWLPRAHLMTRDAVSTGAELGISSATMASRSPHTAGGEPSWPKIDKTVYEYSAQDLHVPMPQDTLVIYVDGGCDGNQHVHLSKHPAGWGVVILFVPRGESEARARKIAEMFGPVVLDKHHFAYLGATVGSNNTAELTALGEALLWLRDHCVSLESLGMSPDTAALPVHVRFDSQYAAKSVLGLFNGPKNEQLIRTIRSIFDQVLKSEISSTTLSQPSVGTTGGTNKVAMSSSSDYAHAAPTSLSELNAQSRQERERLKDLIAQVSRSELTSAQPNPAPPTAPRTTRRFALKFTHVKGHSDNPWNDRADALANQGKQGVHCSVGRFAVGSMSRSPVLVERVDDSVGALPISSRSTRKSQSPTRASPSPTRKRKMKTSTILGADSPSDTDSVQFVEPTVTSEKKVKAKISPKRKASSAGVVTVDLVSDDEGGVGSTSLW